MRLGTLVAVYFIVWWVVLFAVLPWGIRTQQEEGEVTLGTTPSAPARPMLLRKAIMTTIISALVVLVFWLAVVRFGIDFEWIAGLFLPEK
jgi:predicted secreted protein